MEPGNVVLLILLAVVLAAIAIRSVRVVPVAHAGLVERLGRYRRTVEPGLHVVTPFIDRLKPVDMRERITRLESLCIGSDNLRATIGLNVYFKVTDPVRAAYEVADLELALKLLAEYALRNAIGSMTLYQAQGSRDQLNQDIRFAIRNGARAWGVEVSYTEITTVEPA